MSADDHPRLTSGRGGVPRSRTFPDAPDAIPAPQVRGRRAGPGKRVAIDYPPARPVVLMAGFLNPRNPLPRLALQRDERSESSKSTCSGVCRSFVLSRQATARSTEMAGVADVLDTRR
jgi:hypothetical protein